MSYLLNPMLPHLTPNNRQSTTLIATNRMSAAERTESSLDSLCTDIARIIVGFLPRDDAFRLGCTQSSWDAVVRTSYDLFAKQLLEMGDGDACANAAVHYPAFTETPGVLFDHTGTAGDSGGSDDDDATDVFGENERDLRHHVARVRMYNQALVVLKPRYKVLMNHRKLQSLVPAEHVDATDDTAEIATPGTNGATTPAEPTLVQGVGLLSRVKRLLH